MQYKRINILSTRPFLEAVLNRHVPEDINIETQEFITTEPIDCPGLNTEIINLAKEKITAIFTSMNAVEAVADILKSQSPSWQVFALGTATKKLAIQHFPGSTVTGSADNAAELAEEIIANGEINAAVFFCGNQRRDELPDILTKSGIQLKELVVYTTRQLPQRIKKQYNGIMFFSPSAVESFFIDNVLPPETVLFAIGETTAATIEQYSTNKVITSDRPGKEALLEKLISYYNTINHH